MNLISNEDNCYKQRNNTGYSFSLRSVGSVVNRRIVKIFNFYKHGALCSHQKPFPV